MTDENCGTITFSIEILRHVTYKQFTWWLHNNLRKGNGKFTEELKKANVVPAFKKGDKHCAKNYLSVSLLPICSKIFERIIYNTYNYLVDNNLISQNQ